jgi:hypothetical protein
MLERISLSHYDYYMVKNISFTFKLVCVQQTALFTSQILFRWDFMTYYKCHLSKPTHGQKRIKIT